MAFIHMGWRSGSKESSMYWHRVLEEAMGPSPAEGDTSSLRSGGNPLSVAR